MPSLEINNLSVMIKDKHIIDNLNLSLNDGEIHVIMGPNGTGKSTLSRVIMGDRKYKIVNGNITFKDKIINDLTVDERAKLGIFLGMQMPTEIEGVKNSDMLKEACRAHSGREFKLLQFINKLETTAHNLEIPKDMINRSINVGFSGGEKKKNEILQMYMLNPSLIILDEIDSGLDIDSLKIVGENIMNYYYEFKPTILIITHYNMLLKYIKPDFVHVMINGEIVKSGKRSLAKLIEEKGYDYIKKDILNQASEVEKNEEHE